MFNAHAVPARGPRGLLRLERRSDLATALRISASRPSESLEARARLSNHRATTPRNSCRARGRRHRIHRREWRRSWRATEGKAAVAGQDREIGPPRSRHQHVVLKLRHVLVGGDILSEVPGQHELRLEHGAVVRHDPVQGRAHPLELGVAHEALHRADAVPGLALEPAPVQLLGRAAELDEEVA